MSRFFVGDSSSESESDVETVNVNEANDGPQLTPHAPPSKFMMSGDSSSSDEERVRVVRSAKDRWLESLGALLQQIRNHTKITDFNALGGDYDKLQKTLTKGGQWVRTEGAPRVFYKTVATLEDFVAATAKGLKDGSVKKLSPTNNKAYNGLRSKLKKYVETHAKGLKEYRASPSDEEDNGSDADSESESDDDFGKPSTTTATSEPAAAGASKWLAGGDSDSDSSSADDGDPDDWSSDDEDAAPATYKPSGASQASKWFVNDDKASKPKKTKKPAAAPKPSAAAAEKAAAEKAAAEKAAAEKAARTDVYTDANTRWDDALVQKKLVELIAQRGKKGADRKEMLTKLRVLAKVAKSPAMRLDLQLHVLSATFDNTAQGQTLARTLWVGAVDDMHVLLKLAGTDGAFDEAGQFAAPDDEKMTPAQAAAAALALSDSPEALRVRVSANVIVYVEKLEDESVKAMQALDPHSKEYVDRLVDDSKLLDVAAEVQKYYTGAGKMDIAARVASVRLEHIYYKNPEQWSHELFSSATGTTDLILTLSNVVFQHGSDRARTRAALCQITAKALRDDFYGARDLLLMTHLQDAIAHADVPTQILFNRTMIQLGLCAFRAGLMTEAHSALSEVCAAGRARELLGQGLSNNRFSPGAEKDLEKERVEKRRLVPFHMFVSLDLLEATHLVSAMLLEVPNMALNAFSVKPRVISRTFRKWLDVSERALFTGPPENTRDHVIMAAKAMAAGKWEQCVDLILGLPVWDQFPRPEEMKELLRRKIQQESLRAFLFTYGSYYDTLSLAQLSEMFQLPSRVVHRLVSKMMINEELLGSWDQPTGAIVMHKAEPTRLQHLASQLADKVNVMMENNERLLDAQTGGYGYKFSEPAASGSGGAGAGAGGKGGRRGGPGAGR